MGSDGLVSSVKEQSSNRIAGLVSVVIPSYNRESTIGAAIDSVLRQTYQNLEVIVVDDGSTDQTVSIVRKYQDSRVRLIVQPSNAGASAARNAGIAVARGEYIGFQDSDDEWLPEKLAVQVAAMQDCPSTDVVFCALVRVNPNTQFVEIRPNVKPPKARTDFLKAILQRNMMWTQTWLIRAVVFDSGLRFHEHIKRVQDWELAIAMSRQFNVSYVPRVLVLANETDGSLMSLMSQYQIDLTILYRLHGDLLQQYPDLHGQHCRRLAYLSACHTNAKDLRYWLRLALSKQPASLKILAQYLAATLGGRWLYLSLMGAKQKLVGPSP